MNDEIRRREIASLWDKINSIQQSLSEFTELLHSMSLDRIDATEEATCDLDENYAQRIADVEEALCELSERGE